MYRRRIISLVGVLGLIGALMSVPPATAAPPAPAAAPLEWAACPADVVVPVQVQVPVLCAKVPVPLDYRDPDGTQIELTISRIASTNPAKRRGVLLTNPGGPGGSGLAFPALLVSKGLPASVMDSYDLIGQDTRGVGHSSPARCGFVNGEPYWANVPPYAVDDAAVVRQAGIVEDVAERCAANDKDGRIKHLTTANMARDLDRIRIALGAEKASFYGASYGSALGAAYASMFPGTTDRVVVDSNVGDTHLDRAGLRRFALGVEQTFPDFAEWAAVRHGAYGLGRTPEQVRRTYFKIAEKLDKTPAADGTDGTVFRFVTFTSLYSRLSYGDMARNWQRLLNDSAAPAPKAAAAEPNPNDIALTVFLSVTCNDVDWPEDLATYRRAVAQDRKRLPMFGAAAANIIPCAYWKYEPYEPPVEVSRDGPPVLIMQNRQDPATPLAGGKLLRQKFGDRAKLVTVQSSGHGVYVLGDNGRD